MAWEREAQRDDHPGLSASTVRGVHMTLHRALDRARRERLIPRDPTEDCIVPMLPRQEMKILPPESIKAYLQAAEDYGVLPMFYLELVSGLRKGELVALRWNDLNAEKKTVSVNKQATYNEQHEIVLTQPKTDNSIREISIPQEAVELLVQAHKNHPENPYLFPSPRTGKMYHPDSVVNLHKRILKKAGLEHIRFHDLRHTYGTLLLDGGASVKTVQDQLGHTRISTTQIYLHTDTEMRRQAVAKLPY